MFTVKGVKLSSIVGVAPAYIEDNLTNSIFNDSDDAEKYVKTVGVRYRRVTDEDTCTADLFVPAFNKQMDLLKWDKSEVGILIVITQTPEYVVPLQSIILQDRLGLEQTCLCLDVPLGCSGYIYGSFLIASLMQSHQIKKGVLLAGDTLTKQASKKDRSTQPLFSDAATATAFELDATASDMFFDLGNDGSGFQNIMINDGGYRNRFSEESLEYVEKGDGICLRGIDATMIGTEVFSFAISTAPKTVNQLIGQYNIDFDSLDYFVFHQANKYLNEMIRKRLKLPVEKVPYSLYDYGNSASATIPITILDKIQNEIQEKPLKMILSGFGVGLSWGAMYVETNNVIVTPIIHI
ncbi:ketoacyl-ACP synthase III [Flavobacterium galactosidilyticum]|uniref:ketoacyl-ACP synthase III n=1 Tax=Flavobacterium galactosidilyticum TaxID=2893886 RepID=UPI001E3A70DB|nr:ketoacyl-ACP synthase III [Flavobacterium sp. F-340]UFH46670.1 ketoacyl-ACP synthase III [Flavobacterium sp. F-340]